MCCTTKQAIAKYCPYADPEYDHCVADECMAWRWDDGKREQGYCGLAGRSYVYDLEDEK